MKHHDSNADRQADGASASTRWRPGVAAILAMIVAPAACGPAVDPVAGALAGIEPSALQHHVTFLADDSLEGRGTGTAGYLEAAEYVAARFAEHGLEPGGADGGYLAPFPLRSAAADTERSSLRVSRGAVARSLQVGRDYLPSAPVRDTSAVAEGPAVFVGYGLHAPEYERDDYADVDVAGKIVAVLWGTPPGLPAAAAAHLNSTKARVAAARGAVGMLTIPTPVMAAIAPWERIVQLAGRGAMQWLDGEGNPAGQGGSLRAAALLSPDAASTLFANAGHDLAALSGGAAASAFELGATVRLETAAAHTDVQGINVVARLPGRDAELRHELVVVTAHLDHDGIGRPVEGDAIYNGAVDNASGAASLIEMARAFASLPEAPRRTVVFVATDAEEKGLLGAEYFANNPPAPISAVVANVNMDGNHMLFPTRDVIILGVEHSSLDVVARAAAERVGLELSPDPMPEQNFFTRSDHYPFVKRGVPAVFLIGGFNSSDPSIDGPTTIGTWLQAVYHTPKDDLSQTLHWGAGADYTRVAFLIAHEIADATERPTWKPGDFFGDTFGRASE